MAIGGGGSRLQPFKGRRLGAVGEIDWSFHAPGLPFIGARDGAAAGDEDKVSLHGRHHCDFLRLELIGVMGKVSSVLYDRSQTNHGFCDSNSPSAASHIAF